MLNNPFKESIVFVNSFIFDQYHHIIFIKDLSLCLRYTLVTDKKIEEVNFVTDKYFLIHLLFYRKMYLYVEEFCCVKLLILLSLLSTLDLDVILLTIILLTCSISAIL